MEINFRQPEDQISHGYKSLKKQNKNNIEDLKLYMRFLYLKGNVVKLV